MWFNNALIYHYEFKEQIDLVAELSQSILKPCPPHARFVYGWMPVIGEEELVHEVTDCNLICLGKEERILPRAVIQRFLVERIKDMEEQQLRTIKRAERSQIAEDLEFELLPKSFCVQKQLFALFDTLSNRLIVNTSSTTQASQVVSSLRKSVPNAHIEPLLYQENIAMQLAQWISDPSVLPAPFSLASDCSLFSLNDEKKRISCKGYELPAEEILALLSQGLAAAEISLIWQDRIQFTLTHEFTLKRIKSLDYLVDEFNEIGELEEERLQKDAALSLVNGELRGLINDLLKSLSPESLSNMSTQHAQQTQSFPSHHIKSEFSTAS